MAQINDNRNLGLVLIVALIIFLIFAYIWHINYTSEESFTPNIQNNSNSTYQNNMNNNNNNNNNNNKVSQLTKPTNQYLYPVERDTKIDNNNNYVDDLRIDDSKNNSVSQQDYEEDVQDILNNQYDELDDDDLETKRIKRKFITRDTVKDKKYKRVNYVDGVRGNSDENDELSDYYERSNDLIQDDYMENDKFNGFDDTNGKYAVYKQEGPKTDKYKLSEIFNSDNYQPKNIRDDWHQVLPEAVSVKNRHLINVSKPIGQNTVGTSLRNPSWDVRGTPSCPKFVVSPWQQSTIEPDINMKSLCA